MTTKRRDYQGFYSASQVSRLARIPIRTLHSWIERDIIKPSVYIYDKDRMVEEGYSYADLTLIKILRALREDRLDLTSAGIALRHLYERLGPPSKGWADAKVYISDRRIFAEKPDEWETTDATRFGQKTETRLLGDLFKELREQEEEGSILVPKDYSAYVEINPNIMGGLPVVKGTRVPTSILAILKAKGESLAELARLYSPIPKKTILKAIEYEAYLDGAIA